jgi:hypothetical protein
MDLPEFSLAGSPPSDGRVNGSCFSFTGNADAEAAIRCGMLRVVVQQQQRIEEAPISSSARVQHGQPNRLPQEVHPTLLAPGIPVPVSGCPVNS